LLRHTLPALPAPFARRERRMTSCACTATCALADLPRFFLQSPTAICSGDGVPPSPFGTSLCAATAFRATRFLESASRRSQDEETSVRFFWRILLTAFASCCYLGRNKRSIVADRYMKDCLFPSSCLSVIPNGIATEGLAARDRESPKPSWRNPGGNKLFKSRMAEVLRPRWVKGPDRGD
jgi:hypothetical protein